MIDLALKQKLNYQSGRDIILQDCSIKPGLEESSEHILKLLCEFLAKAITIKGL